MVYFLANTRKSDTFRGRQTTPGDNTKIFYLLLGIVISFNCYIIFGMVDTIYCAEEASTLLSINNDNSKLERILKYVHTYRYISQSPRYNYLEFPPSICGAGPHYDTWFSQSSAMRSKVNEDKFIYETFFKNKQPASGTYIELGAFDGVTESNSNFFDTCLGWEGLLIEGNPVMYEKVIQNRPFAHKMSVAPSCTAEYESVNHTIPFYRVTLSNAGLVGHAKGYENSPNITNVPCGPLSPILEDVFAKSSTEKPTVDFFSLDVEGSEDKVLATIDFQKIQINVLMIEIRNQFCKDDNCEVRKRVRGIMNKAGYKQYRDLVWASDIYVHPQSPYQIPLSMAQPQK